MAFLIASDVLKLLAVKQDYDVRAREQTLIARASSSDNNGNNQPPNLSAAGATSSSRRHIASGGDDDAEDDDDDDDGGFRERNNQQQQQLSDLNRLRLDERRRERPLLTNGRTTPLAEPELEDDDDGERNFRAGPSAGACLPPTILTRANYVSRPPQTRPKSPVFVGASRSSSPSAGGGGGSSSPASPRGVLKKSGSLSRSMDRSDSLSGIRAPDADDEFESYQRQLQQSLQTQRPLFNVRFAE